jgi:hypothetical protein
LLSPEVELPLLELLLEAVEPVVEPDFLELVLVDVLPSVEELDLDLAVVDLEPEADPLALLLLPDAEEPGDVLELPMLLELPDDPEELKPVEPMLPELEELDVSLLPEFDVFELLPEIELDVLPGLLLEF